MRRDVAYYQGASHAFSAGLLRWRDLGPGRDGDASTTTTRPLNAHPEG